MIWLRRVLPMLLGAGLLYLCFRLYSDNGMEVDVDYVVGKLEGVALWKALGGSFALGAALVGSLLAIEVVRSRLTMRRYRKRLSGLETEVHQLRNLPLGAEQLTPLPSGIPNRGGAAPPFD